MTQIEMFQTATSSQPDIRANHFHKPESVEAQKMTDISGRSFFPLFKAKDPLGAFSKMFMGTSLWGSTKCYLTWRGKATPQGRSLFQLVPRTHLTEEIDSGLSQEMWATPVADDTGIRKKKYSQGGTALSMQASQEMWPTPRASAGMNDSMQSANKQVNKKGYKHKLEQAVAMWPTPAARDYKGANSYERTKNKLEQGERAQMGQLPNAVMMQEGKQISGSLNPQWVEWLMGYPEGWTDLKD